MSDGLLVVDKPAGMTSHDVVARVRRLAGTRKVGHAGTLDPMATGVLLVGIDRATRLLGHLAGQDKDYTATIRLGVTTTSDDAQGDVVESVDASHVTDRALAVAVAGQRGDLEQVPSSVSAVKVDGKRAYARVRDGEQVELAARSVHVERFEVLRRDGDLVEVAVSCTTGTYVRALARDVGATLGVGGHLTRLRRTRVGAFDETQAASLEDLARSLVVLPLADVLRRGFPTVEVDNESARRIGLGQRLVLDLPGDGPVGVLDPAGEAVALVVRRTDGSAQPTVVLRTG